MDHMFNSRVEEAIDNLQRKHNLYIEGLTEQQFAAAIKQAIEAGDFHRLILPNDASTVVYVPYREVMNLKAKIAALEARLGDLPAPPQFNGIPPHHIF